MNRLEIATALLSGSIAISDESIPSIRAISKSCELALSVADSLIELDIILQEEAEHERKVSELSRMSEKTRKSFVDAQESAFLNGFENKYEGYRDALREVEENQPAKRVR